LRSFDGKTAQEGIRGKWILEIAEMQTLDKSSVNVVKGFITQRSDHYRVAYGENPKTFPRQCVFFGTTNDFECLRDTTGGRRFWPIVADVQPRTKDVSTDLPNERDQIWAEALTYWRLGEKWYLDKELEAVAERIQEEHRETHPWEDTIIDFVNRDVPDDWDKWDLQNRRLYWSGTVTHKGAIIPRVKVCVLEIWLEALAGFSINKMSVADKRVIRGVLERLPGWKRSRNSLYFGKAYGTQKGFIRWAQEWARKKS
jgi:hypothetical protein